MMTVKDLSKEQLKELKGNHIVAMNDEKGEGTSWGELAMADELVSDEEIYEAYDGYVFSDDDFACTANVA